nr:hypothetical protein [uncultured Rhodopila sp.]
MANSIGLRWRFEPASGGEFAGPRSVHYPGTYLAGGYNRLKTDIAGRVVENEDLVNFPNWLALDFRIADEDWFSARTAKILSYRQEIDLRRGMLLRTVRFEDRNGRCSLVREQRLVSMADMHLGAMELELTAENWSGPVTVRSAIDGRVVNAGAKLYQKFNGRHLEPLAGDAVGENSVFLLVRTSQSHIQVAQVARTQIFLDGRLIEAHRRVINEPGYIGHELTADIKQGESLVAEKLISFYTSRDQAISECGLAARKASVRAGRFDAVKADHVLAWEHLWRRFDVRIQPAGPGYKLNISMLLRLNMFHLLQTVSLHSIGLDIGIPRARLDRGSLSRPHLLGRIVYIPVL